MPQLQQHARSHRQALTHIIYSSGNPPGRAGSMGALAGDHLPQAPTGEAKGTLTIYFVLLSRCRMGSCVVTAEHMGLVKEVQRCHAWAPPVVRCMGASGGHNWSLSVVPTLCTY